MALATDPAVDRRRLAHLALVGIALLWGSTFVLVKQALENASTLLFLTLRFWLGTAALGLLFRRQLRGRRLGPAVGPGVQVGGLLFLGYLFQTLGLRLTTPAKSGLLTGMAVVLVPVFSGLVERRWPSGRAWAGVGSAAAGLYLLAAPPGRLELGAGDLLTVICAAAFGLHIVFVGRYSPLLGAPVLAVAQVVVAAALSLGAVFWAEPVYLRWTPFLALALGVTGLLCTALAFWLQTWAQQFASPTHTALILTLEPVFAWLTSYLVLGERLGARGGVGGVLILAGILLAEW